MLLWGRGRVGERLCSPASFRRPGAATLTHHTAGAWGMSATPGAGHGSCGHGISTGPVESCGLPLFALTWGLSQGIPGWAGERPRAPLPGSPPHPRPKPCPIALSAAGVWFRFASALFVELSLAHTFSACLHFPVALLVGVASPLPLCGGSRPCGKVSDLPEVRFPTLEIGITNSRGVQGRRQMMLEGQ